MNAVRHMTARWPLSRVVVAVYVGLVAIALLLASVRLQQSTDMPGLAAIELILLAVPWSFALGVEPLSRWGWGGMVGIVLGGLILNGVLVRPLARWIQRVWAHETCSAT